MPSQAALNKMTELRSSGMKHMFSDVELLKRFLAARERTLLTQGPDKLPHVSWPPSVRVSAQVLPDRSKLLELYTNHNEDATIPSCEAVLIYVHGGGFFLNLDQLHANFCARIARELNMGIYLPLYPLLPTANYEEMLATIRRAYSYVAKKHPRAPIILAGDSAGANLILALCQYAQASHKPLRPKPSLLALLSPYLDLRGSLGQDAQEEACDPLLSWAGSRYLADLLETSTDRDAIRPDPFFASIESLPPLAVCWGTQEILHRSISAFCKKIASAGGSISSLCAAGLYHTYPLNQGMGIPEAEEGFAWIKQQIQGVYTS